MNTPVISAQRIRESYGRGSNRFDALKDVTLSVRSGESVAIVGKSGSGKSAADVTITKQDEQSDATDSGPTKHDPDRASPASGQSPRRGAISALSPDDIETIRVTPGIVDTNPVTLVLPDYIEYELHGKFELSIDATAAVTTRDLVASSNFDESSTTDELLLPNESLFAGGVRRNRLLTDNIGDIQNQGKPSTTIEGFTTATAHINPNSSSAEVDQIKADLDRQGFGAQTTAPASITAIIGVVMLIVFLAGTLPAGRAARQNPIDALRYE